MSIQSGQNQLVTFRLGSETYGVPISRVREVLHFRPVTRIPQAPEFVEGVIQVRDHVIPVVDMRRRLRIDADATRARRIIVLDLPRPLGIVVDDISRVFRLEEESFEELPEAVAGEGGGCISRLAKTDDGLVIIIAPERVLARSEAEELAGFAARLDRESAHADGKG